MNILMSSFLVAPYCAQLACKRNLSTLNLSAHDARQVVLIDSPWYLGVIHNPALSFQTAFSLHQFCLELFTFTATSWTIFIYVTLSSLLHVCHSEACYWNHVCANDRAPVKCWFANRVPCQCWFPFSVHMYLTHRLVPKSCPCI